MSQLTTTDFIATLALVTSVVSLTYTIVVDRRKPRLSVFGNIVHLVSRDPDASGLQGLYFQVVATNHGPGRIRVDGMGLRFRSRIRRLWRKFIVRNITEAVVIDTSPNSPHQLPRWLDVGDSLTLLYPSDSEFLEESKIFDCFYLYDSLGNNHWPPRGVFNLARESRASARARIEDLKAEDGAA